MRSEEGTEGFFFFLEDARKEGRLSTSCSASYTKQNLNLKKYSKIKFQKVKKYYYCYCYYILVPNMGLIFP